MSRSDANSLKIFANIGKRLRRVNLFFADFRNVDQAFDAFFNLDKDAEISVSGDDRIGQECHRIGHIDPMFIDVAAVIGYGYVL